MAMGGGRFFELCERLHAEWRERGIRLSSEWDAVFQIDHLPEPYLLFGDPSNPLVFLTTNPGAGQDYQHRDAILSINSGVGVRPDAPYREFAVVLARFYGDRKNLSPAASARIAAMRALATRAGFSGVLQVESIPFHSRVLPGKAKLSARVRRDPLLVEYAAALRDFLVDRTIVAVSAAGSRRSLGVETIRDSAWLSWQAEVMSLDLCRAENQPLVVSCNGKVSCALVADRLADSTKALVLMMGSNSLPAVEGEGFATIAARLR